MKCKKILFGILAVIVFIAVIFAGYIFIRRCIAINDFKNEVQTYLKEKYTEEMYVNDIGIDPSSGLYAYSYPVKDTSLSFMIRKIDGVMIDGYLAEALENELGRKIENEILSAYDVCKCDVVLNGNALIKENLYSLYYKYSRPARLDELSELPEIDYILVTVETDNEEIIKNGKDDIIKSLSESFGNQKMRIAININGEFVE